MLLLPPIAVFAWLYGEYLAGHSVPVAAFAMPPLAALALGGLVDPRILWSVGPRRASMPKSIRVIGAIIFAIGLATSAALLVWAPRPA